MAVAAAVVSLKSFTGVEGAHPELRVCTGVYVRDELPGASSDVIA